tara:strand:+ start:2521 stop:3192 length:672 start_codon:yes stop_codon:yes gene_type:complete
MTSECNEYRDLLPDLVDDQLSSLQKQRVDQHLNHCDDCAESLQQLWQMQALASRWDDQPVPHWNRRKTFFPETSWLPNLQWVSSFASVMVLVLVITQANVSTADGLTIKFGDHSGVSQETLAKVLTELEMRQEQELQRRVANLSTNQVAANQLLLRTVMEMSREERKDELSTLLTVWDYAQEQRAQQTEESISLLLASQVEDKRNINQINRLLRQASVEGNNL